MMTEVVLLGVTALAFALSLYFTVMMYRRAESVSEDYQRLSAAFSKVDKGQAELDKVEQVYRALQAQYTQKQHELASNRQIIAQYDIGIGTVDEKLVQFTHSTNDIDDLQKEL